MTAFDKGRVERAAGTFQDRLVTELRLDGASTLIGANYLLKSFLERYNRQFAVSPAQSRTAYRPLDPDLDLDVVLSFRHSRRVARDNTVRYRWQLIQLVPSAERPSYAGSRVELIEHINGRLQVAFAGKIIPSHLCPPRPGLMRTGRADGDPGRLQRQLEKVEQLPDVVPAMKRSRRRVGSNRRRQPTARQKARWQAVQAAKAKGMNISAIARELGISRKTVRKYVKATVPPRNPPSRQAAIIR